MAAEESVIPRNGPTLLELPAGGGVLILDPFSSARALIQRKRRVAKQLVA